MANAFDVFRKAFGYADPSALGSNGLGQYNELAQNANTVTTTGTGQSLSDLQNAAANMQKYQMARDLQIRQMQSQIQNNMLRNQMSGMGAFTVSATGYAPDPATVPLRVLTVADLEHEAGKANLEELADLWRARWGDKWVKRDEISDEFYNVAASRLFQSNRLEAHELADSTRVFRLIEK